MKTATVRELRNRYSELLKWIDAGEEVQISRRGKVIARLVPEKQAKSTANWKTSAALRLDRSSWPVLSTDESTEVLKDSRGRY